MTQLLKNNANFRRYWVAICITSIGDYIDDIAFAQLVYIITKSTLLMSYVFAIKIVLTFLSIFTATYVDKHNKKNIIRLTTIAQGVNLLCILIIYKLNFLSTALLLIFVTVQTIFSTFSIPAQNAIMPLLVKNEELINARSAISIFLQFIQIFAYMFSGILINYIGISGVMFIDAITFFVSAMVISFVVTQEFYNKSEVEQGFFFDVGEGIRYVIKVREIFIILIITFLGNMFSAPVDSLMPAYFAQANYRDSAYSIFMVGIAVGGCLGNWILTKLQKLLSGNKMFALGFGFGAVGMMCLVYNRFYFPFISAILIGVSYGMVSIMNATLLQIMTPDDMLARVFSIFKCISYIASPVGIVMAGYMGEFIEMKWIFGIFGLLLLWTGIMTKFKVSKQIEST